jgi:hypothetical protein
MDAERFDTLARIISTAGSRRRAVATAVGGALTLFGLVDSHEAAAKKKKACPPCKKRKKGKCKGKLPDGTGCPGGSCRAGSCIAASPPPPPPCAATGCPYGDVCQGQVCVNCLGAPCVNNGQCCTNFCAAFTACACAFGNFGPDFGCTSNAQCCNGSCNLATGKCDCDPAGSPCTDSSTCCGTCSGSGVCQ